MQINARAMKNPQKCAKKNNGLASATDDYSAPFLRIENEFRANVVRFDSMALNSQSEEPIDFQS